LCDALVLPTFVFGKVNMPGVSVTGSTPVPDSVTVCGLLRALSVKVSVPDCRPKVAGVKVTLTLQLFPTAHAAPVHVFAEIAKFPLTETELKVSRRVPLLVTVTV